MSPKTVPSHINLILCGLGFAERFQWEKETLVDYLAQRIGLISEFMDDQIDAHGIAGRHQYEELRRLAEVIQRHPNIGLKGKIDLGNIFMDLRDFVVWEKEELADVMIQSVIEYGLSDLMEASDQKEEADEIGMIAFQILCQQNPPAAERAEEERENYRKCREAQAAFVAQSPTARAKGRASPAAAGA